MRAWEKIKDIAAYAVAGLIGIAILLFAMFGFVIPQQDRKKRNEAKAKAEGLKKKVEEVKAARDAKVDQQVAVVKEKAVEEKKQDPLDFANALIADETKKG